MRIYTRSGDAGKTSLIYGQRVDKDDTRVEAYGTVDELNSTIGFAVSLLGEDDKFTDLRQMTIRIQRDLFDVGREIATPPEKRTEAFVQQDDVNELEQMIDVLDEELEPLKAFILPGGSTAAASWHVARTVARRAERIMVRLHRDADTSAILQMYLNRLSDFLFVAARVVNHRLSVSDVIVDFQGDKPEWRSEDDHRE